MMTRGLQSYLFGILAAALCIGVIALTSYIKKKCRDAMNRKK